MFDLSQGVHFCAQDLAGEPNCKIGGNVNFEGWLCFVLESENYEGWLLNENKTEFLPHHLFLNPLSWRWQGLCLRPFVGKACVLSLMGAMLERENIHSALCKQVR